MKLFKYSGILFFTFMFISCQDQGTGGKGKAFSVDKLNEDQKALYAIGAMYGGRLKELNLGPEEMKLLLKGVEQTGSGKEPLINLRDYRGKVEEIFKKRREIVVKENEKQGKEYVDKFLKEEGASQTSSGLAYKILKSGEGKSPKETDTVEVHYHGTLISGEVFDSSVDRKQTATFPLNRVIKGWTEGLQLLKEAGKIRLVIPSNLAYGNFGAPPKIPGGATLVFDVELIAVK